MRDNKNSAWLAIQYIITIIFSLVALKLNLEHYGKELFGSWILVSSLWGFGRALDFGLGTSVVKFVAEFNSKNSPELKSIISSCFFLMLGLGVIIYIVIIIIAELLYFGGTNIFSSGQYDAIWKVFIILGLSFYLNYLVIIIKSYFEGMSDFVTPSKINIVYVTSILISVIISYLFDKPIVTLAIYFFLCSVLNLILHAFIFKKKFYNVRISLRLVKLNLIKKVFSFSIAIQGVSILGSLIDPLIKYLIGNFNSIGLVSVYEIARRFVNAITGLFNTTFRTILPKASVLFNRSHINEFLYNECAKLSKFGITYSGTVFGIGTLILPIIIQQVFQYDEAILMYFILAIPESINSFGYSIYNFLIGIERAYFLVLVQLINVIIIGGSVAAGLLISKNILGLLGYGFTVLIVNVLMIIFVRKITGISIRNYLIVSKVYKLIILLLFLLSAILILSNDFISFHLVSLIIACLSSVVFYNDIKNYSKDLFKKIGFNKND